jgi:conjugative transfer signal peptidase TraF
MKSSRARGLVLGSAILGILISTGAIVRALPFDFNTTASEPIGLYRLVGTHTMYQPGSFVEVCLPAAVLRTTIDLGIRLQRGRCPGGVVPLIKRVAAGPEQRVCVSEVGVFVNGHPLPDSRPQPKTTAGKPLHADLGCHVVPAAEVWVASTNPRGYDSRYFGPVRPLTAAVPVLTYTVQE